MPTEKYPFSGSGAPPSASNCSSSTSRKPVSQSLQMLDAQKTFRRVVKSELNRLLSQGIEREEAVRLLLKRIVKSTEEPSAVEVNEVMKQFKMNKEDAVRALIVKQELGRLKRRGLDPLSAIEDLTMKMKGMNSMVMTMEGHEEGDLVRERFSSEDLDVDDADESSNEEEKPQSSSHASDQDASVVFEAVVQTPIPNISPTSKSSDSLTLSQSPPTKGQEKNKLVDLKSKLSSKKSSQRNISSSLKRQLRQISISSPSNDLSEDKIIERATSSSSSTVSWSADSPTGRNKKKIRKTTSTPSYNTSIHSTPTEACNSNSPRKDLEDPLVVITNHTKRSRVDFDGDGDLPSDDSPPSTRPKKLKTSTK